ncbi:uncharacterized protein BJ212DRAFT_1444821 [Suillus subaureus]|uniref:Uncharacterized protein n=1 Tax=Suillus subaureus TaxID=48587 RepID=A0A9P7JI50_9AGAM|nr:uncharacterized protein BJ212DRAFT_1444821 [Suillus subaureus]KAG1823918.1 hypothetical protein BJ212DRAFT_1444821 [Suillus subaureus]
MELTVLEEEAVLLKQADAIAFIKLLQVVSLDDPVAKLDDAVLSHLRNPYQTGLEINSSAVQHGIATYFTVEHSSVNTYESIQQSAMHCLEGEATQIPSYYNYTGVESIEHDMCPGTCVAFMGPFADLTHYPICNTDHYNPIKLHTSGGQMHIAHQKFITIPLSAQLQALWPNGGVFDVFDDFCKGCEFLQAVQWGDIKPDDIVLMISLNGAQLYESKLSDCWTYIWKQYVLPGGFIPGPNKLKNMDSFLFPGLHHLAALQNEGLCIWDAWHNIVFISNSFLIFITADGPGLVYFDGMKGTYYYPALLIPHHYAVAGSNHPDISIYELHDPDLTEYFDNLLKLYCKL